MSQTTLTAGAVCRTIDHELGVAAVVVQTPNGTTTSVDRYRSGGLQLEVIGLLKSLLLATKGRDAAELHLHAPRVVIEAVTSFLDSGVLTLPEALHQLPAVARIYRARVDAGWQIELHPRPIELSDVDAGDLEDARAHHAAAHEAKHTEPWRLPQADADWVASVGARVVYTDGSHMPETGFGSWAWWVDEDTHASGTNAALTSTHAERIAVSEAVRSLEGPLLVVTDLDGLLPANGYGRTVTGAHARVLGRLRHQLADERIRILVVKGHETCPGNLQVDRLAGAALAKAWARITRDAELVERLVGLVEHRASRLKDRRAAATVRHHNKYEAWVARQARAERLAAQGSGQESLPDDPAVDD